MKNKLIALLLVVVLVVISIGSLFAQNIVKDTSNVKKPAYGKLYFSKSDTTLYLYTKTFKKISTAAMQGGSIIINPPNETNPTLTEIPLGYWESPDRILVAKLLEGKYHVLQTNPTRTYYVPRGKNLLTDYRTQINADIITGNLLPTIISTDSDLGGLYPPTSFKESQLIVLGYQKNTNGEFVKSNTPITNPPVTEPPVADDQKIKIPVGVVFWDNWERDYWNDSNPKYDYLINHISANRLAVTEWSYKYNLLPFYGQYHAPEKIKIRYNVRWSQADGRNLYDEREAIVEVKFDKTAADTEREVRYYKEAGFDWICFNYYASDSYLSNTRLQFVAMPNKMGMKMTFMLASNRSAAEIDYITTLMTQDYWFKIDNKPVLYFGEGDFSDLPKYRASLSSKGISDIYVVYYAADGYPGDWQDIQSKRCNAVSAYMTSSTNHSAEALISDEVFNRENWMGQFKATHVNLIPVITNGLENLQKRTSLSTETAGYIEGATLEQLSRKTKLVGEFAKKYADKVPAILWYAGNELLECGEKSLVPKRLRNGSIDSSTLDTIAKHLE
ncbi:MAG: hypothetical protein Q8K92_19910 [Leadbetterella sp.]|nr:hypothetical protein [Leadbetterella sp.]